MKNDYIKATGNKDEIVLSIANFFQIDKKISESIFDFIENNPNILSDTESFREEIEELHIPKVVLGFLTPKKHYSINIKAITVFIASLLIDSKIEFPASSIGLAIVGLKKLITTTDQVPGAKCVLLEIIRKNDKKTSADLFSDNKGQCINNSLECKYRKVDGVCICSPENVKDILNCFVGDGVLKESGGIYSYSPLGYL